MLAAKERTLFKCMGFSCAFSTGDSGQFSRHLADQHTGDQLLAALRTVHVRTTIIFPPQSCASNPPSIFDQWIRVQSEPEDQNKIHKRKMSKNFFIKYRYRSGRLLIWMLKWRLLCFFFC
jgi:hypothetical protein